MAPNWARDIVPRYSLVWTPALYMGSPGTPRVQAQAFQGRRLCGKGALRVRPRRVRASGPALSISGPCQAWDLWALGPGVRCARSWGSFCRCVRRRRSVHVSDRGALKARSSVSGFGDRVPALFLSGPGPLCALGAHSVLQSLSRRSLYEALSHPSKPRPPTSEQHGTHPTRRAL